MGLDGRHSAQAVCSASASQTVTSRCRPIAGSADIKHRVRTAAKPDRHFYLPAVFYGAGGALAAALVADVFILPAAASRRENDDPSDAALAELKQSKFSGTEKCYSYYIGVLIQLGMKPGCSIFDYGCSWDYGSYQLSQAGFEVMSFEVAPTRRRYAHEKLGVRTVDDMDLAATDRPDQFDCFFSAHVLEHVPSPAKSFNYAMRLLKRDGLFVSFTPNGCILTG